MPPSMPSSSSSISSMPPSTPSSSSSISSMPGGPSQLKETSTSIISSQDENNRNSPLSSGLDFGVHSRYNIELRLHHPIFSFFFDNKEFVCGWGSAVINTFVTFPINKLIFRQQLHGISGFKAVAQLRKDGFRFLYRGLLPPLFQKTTSISIMFGMYCRSQKTLQDLAPSLSARTNTIVSAFIAGTLEASLCPLERVQTLMQNRKYHNKFANTFAAFRYLSRYGATEYYRGLSVIVLRNGPSNCCFFFGREFLKVTDPKHSAGEKVARDFVSGAVLGAVISTLFFPVNVVKTHMQSQLGGPFISVWRTFNNVLAERSGSVRLLFKGVHLNYTRSFISWGIINASYEILMKLFRQEHDRRRL